VTPIYYDGINNTREEGCNAEGTGKAGNTSKPKAKPHTTFRGDTSGGIENSRRGESEWPEHLRLPSQRGDPKIGRELQWCSEDSFFEKVARGF
jgi:hypothetical protein